jgi:hypothetical protein
MIFAMLFFFHTNASGALVEAFFESFDIDTTTTLETQNTYPSFSFNVSGSAIVSSGVLQLESAGDGSDDSATISGFTEEVIVSVDIGLSTSLVGYSNVGLMIGDNYILFHPGFGGGALRVTGPGGFGTTNMGFTPALDVLHHMQVHVHPSGLFEIQITDANNQSNVFTKSFTNSSSVGGNITLQRQGASGEFHLGLYDNLLVEVVSDFTCIGFEAPLDGPPVRVHRKRALPFKAQLFADGLPASDTDIIDAPVIQVEYTAMQGDSPIDVTDDALAVGLGTEGNEFVFTNDEKWQFNLKTSNYSANGIYKVSMVPGDGYVIYPTCEASFVIE